jgi:hypothetical protein
MLSVLKSIIFRIDVWWRPLVWNHIMYPDLKNVKLAPANAQTGPCFTRILSSALRAFNCQKLGQITAHL